jgi:hypothetical protein
MAATIKNRYPGLYSITSSIEEDPCAAESRAPWETKRTSGEAVDRVDPTPLTRSGHKRDRNPAAQQSLEATDVRVPQRS